jgi:hypothetical protein
MCWNGKLAAMRMTARLLPGSNSDNGIGPRPDCGALSRRLSHERQDTRSGWSEARVLPAQYQNIKSADLSDFKDATTQAVVWPSSLASGTLIYPYAKAKRNV